MQWQGEGRWRTGHDGLSAADAEEHHAASPWRHRLVRAVLRSASDPDIHIADWLQLGAPMGMARPIPAGGLLPRTPPSATMSLADLEALPRVERNHPSFDTQEGKEHPAHKLFQDLVDQGFGRIYAGQQKAEHELGVSLHPSPMGDITKPKSDGTLKHRLIQDQRRNSVNATVHLTERQALPRFVDHAHALAAASTRPQRWVF